MTELVETRKRGPYAKSAKTRERAVEAAIEIFSSAGYHGATLTDVAAKVGMTLTGLQHHFPDKDALLAAVLAERDERARANAAIQTGEDATEKLIAITVQNQQEPLLTELHCILSAEATSAEHPAHGYFVRRYAEQRQRATEYFQDLMSQGKLGTAIGSESLGSLLIAVADGLQLQWLLDRESVDMQAEMRTFLTVAVPAMAAGLDAAAAPRT